MRTFAMGCLLGLAMTGIAAEPVVERVNRRIEAVRLDAPDGKSIDLQELKGKRATVVVFLSFECPVSNSYSSALAELAKQFQDQGIAFVGVHAADDANAARLAKLARDYQLPFPVLADANFRAADALKATTAPEAFLLDHNLVLRYRGRIDNGYSARLKKNAQTTRQDLRVALEQLLANKPILEPVTPPIGCPIQRLEKSRATGNVTYHRDVLPILQAHCQQCHRPGEVGPFSLLTYKQAVNWASDIKEFTQNRKMPPWKPVEGETFHNERRLTDRQLATLAAWVDGGTPEGDPKSAPPARTFTDGWQLGKPDLVLTVPEPMTIGPAGRDLFRVFVLPTHLQEDKHVVAIEVRPGNRRVVHHTLNFIDTTGQGRRLEQQERERVKKPGEQDHGPGYSVKMGVGFVPLGGGLGGWAPGQMARRLPNGTGYLLPKGSDVVVQTHYHRTGREEKDQLSIGLYFADKPVPQLFKAAIIPGRFLFIPAGAADFTVRGTIELEQDCTLHSVMPHMHMLGKSIQVTITPPGESARTLLAIRDWDYNWQETYFLKEPLHLKAGTRLTVEAHYDNSDKNPMNPFHPPRIVIFGEQTDNEMCFVFLGGTSDAPGRRIRTKRLDSPIGLRLPAGR